METTRRRRYETREDFLRWEREQDERWEFLDNVIRMMAGGRVNHNRVAGNVYAALRAAALKRGCEAFQQNQKLAPEHDDMAVVYPDVFVTCRRLDGDKDTVPSATVIVEVTSKSTREDDYTWKWDLYRDMPDLRHYLIVDPDKRRVSHYHRPHAGEDWRLRILAPPDGVVTVTALEVELPLADIFAGLEERP